MDHVKVDIDARGVATLWLARPEKHNALTQQMMVDITDTAKALGADEAIRVVVLAAEGPTFCAGGDLGWMKDQMAATADDRRAGALVLAGMLEALNTLPKPLIGRVQGNAFGGGVGMMSVCDVCIGTEGALFGLTETRLGLIPATIGPYVVARMGEGQARQVFMNSRRFDAQEAQGFGLLAKVVPAGGLDAAVMAEVDPYLSCAPQAVAQAKALLRTLGPDIDMDAIAASIDALVAVWEGPEATEGISAFFEKRQPSWAV